MVKASQNDTSAHLPLMVNVHIQFGDCSLNTLLTTGATKFVDRWTDGWTDRNLNSWQSGQADRQTDE